MKEFLRLVVVLTIYLQISGDNQFRYDYTYIKKLKGWMKYHEIPSTWHDARFRCHMEGAELASPTTREVGEAMSKMMDQKSDCAVFTGIHATFSKGDYNTLDGLPLTDIPHYWAPGEPDNYNNEEDCLIMMAGMTLADVKCSDVHPYICYKKNSDMNVTNCGTLDPEYNLDTRTGKCYKFHKVPAATWSRAYMTCVAEGGHLVIINSEIESNLIMELFAKFPAETLNGTLYKDTAYIGFHDWGVHGHWRTIHGQTLIEAGFDKFSPGEPNNLTTGQFCGSVLRDGLLNDLWCENLSVFICEKLPSKLVSEEEVNDD